MNRLTAILLLALAAVQVHAIRISAGPYLQNVTPTEATFVWVTDSNALSWVEIAPDDGNHFYAEERPKYYAVDLGRAIIGTLHKVTVKGLKPGTTYRYRVCSREVLEQQPYYVAYGHTVYTDVYGREPLRFRTVDPGQSDISFMIVNDIHQDSLKFVELMRNFKPGKTDFVVYNGDMLNFMDGRKRMVEGMIRPSSKQFASETPFYMVRGNHESRGNHALHYMDYYVTPTDKPYYTFSRGPVFFIVLDGGEDKPDSDIEYYGTSFGDDYRAEQARWLAEVVETPEFKASPYRVVLTHVPPVGDTWHGPLHAKQLFLPILNRAGIDLMICAHLHTSKYLAPGSEGADFPVLINSHNTALNVDANPSQMTVTTVDRSGNTLSTRSYSPR